MTEGRIDLGERMNEALVLLFLPVCSAMLPASDVLEVSLR